MRLRLIDSLLLVCLLCGFAAMLLTFRGSPELGALSFLAAFVAHVLFCASSAPVPGFSREFDDVVQLVSFSIAPGLLLYGAYAPMSRYGALAVGALPVATGAVRLAYRVVRERPAAASPPGLPRPLSALFLVALCSSCAFHLEPIRLFGIGLVVLVTLLNLLRFPFWRPYAYPLSRARLLVLAGVVVSVSVAFGLGHGFDALLAWATSGLVAAGLRWRLDPARARGTG